MANCHFCKKHLDPSLMNVNQDDGWVMLEYRRPLVSDFHPVCLCHAGVKEAVASKELESVAVVEIWWKNATPDEKKELIDAALLKRRKAEIWKNASWAERNVISETEKSQV